MVSEIEHILECNIKIMKNFILEGDSYMSLNIFH